MTQFDSFIKKLFLEDLSNMGPAVGPAASSSSPSYSTTSTTVNPPQTTTAQGSQAGHGELDIDKVLNDKTTKWRDWLSKDYNGKALTAHVMKTVFDPKSDPMKRTSTLSLIGNNPDLSNYFGSMIGNMTK